MPRLLFLLLVLTASAADWNSTPTSGLVPGARPAPAHQLPLVQRLQRQYRLVQA